jgi:hypothetical protein
MWGVANLCSARHAGAAVASTAARGSRTVGAARGCGKAQGGVMGVGRLGDEDVPRTVMAAGGAHRREGLQGGEMEG